MPSVQINHQAFIPLVTVQEMRALETIVLREYHSFENLMEAAGTAVFAALRQHYPACKQLGVICGPGHNGGDGWVVARLAHKAGYAVTVMELDTSRSRLTQQQYEKYIANGGKVSRFVNELPEVEIWVDAILGIGCDRAPEGIYAAAIDALNAQKMPVVAIDVPTGVNADTGAVLGKAVQAAHTFVLLAGKRGLYTGQALEYVGIPLLCLALPAHIISATHFLLPSTDCVQPLLRARNSHKGSCGRLLILAGGQGYLGAAILSAKAALRTGVGLVQLLTHPGHAVLGAVAMPELLSRGVRHLSNIIPEIPVCHATALGMGLGQSPWAQRIWEDAKIHCPKPWVVDADALNYLAKFPYASPDWVLTPHVGEASRLLQNTPEDIAYDRFAASQELVARYSGVVVLKGAGTLIRDKDVCYVCSTGNPKMATAGMGDALSGILGALLAQGNSLIESALSAAWLHGAAADNAAKQHCFSVLASDVIDALTGWAASYD